MTDYTPANDPIPGHGDPFAAYRGLAPGWYRDPSNPATLRFWDGNALSEATQPGPPPVADPFAAYRGLAPGWYRDPSDPSSLRYWDGISLSQPTRRVEPVQGAGASQFGSPGAFANTTTPGPFVPRAGNDIRFEPSRLGTGDFIAGGASVLLLVSLFLPWYSVNVGVLGISVSATANGLYHGWMYITLLLCIAIVGYLIVRAMWNGLRVPAPHWQLLAGATGLNLLLTVIAFLDKPTVTSWSYGAFVGIVASVGALVGSVVRAQQPEILSGHAPQSLS
jgi:hypothetical protein